MAQGSGVWAVPRRQALLAAGLQDRRQAAGAAHWVGREMHRQTALRSVHHKRIVHGKHSVTSKRQIASGHQGHLPPSAKANGIDDQAPSQQRARSSLMDRRAFLILKFCCRVLTGVSRLGAWTVSRLSFIQDASSCDGGEPCSRLLPL